MYDDSNKDFFNSFALNFRVVQNCSCSDSSTPKSQLFCLPQIMITNFPELVEKNEVLTKGKIKISDLLYKHLFITASLSEFPLSCPICKCDYDLSDLNSIKLENYPDFLYISIIRNDGLKKNFVLVEVEKEIKLFDERYQLISVVYHIGDTVSSGHYICHIFDGKCWVLFNDDIVEYNEDFDICQQNNQYITKIIYDHEFNDTHDISNLVYRKIK